MLDNMFQESFVIPRPHCLRDSNLHSGIRRRILPIHFATRVVYAYADQQTTSLQVDPAHQAVTYNQKHLSFEFRFRWSRNDDRDRNVPRTIVSRKWLGRSN